VATAELVGVSKRFGDNTVVRDVDLRIEDGSFVVLVGPSGCGKSTTLRMVAGLEEPTSGTIRIGDRDVGRLSPRDRDIAMVFQSYALYPHMKVFDNLAFGLRLRKLPREEISQRVDAAAQMLGLTDLLERKPGQLSGGQRQRVAMGRAIVRQPAVFLFDEPLSNLDAKLRVQMRVEIAKLHQRLGTTIIYVTHDQVEAMTLADQIVVMNDGVIQQVGAPLHIYREPANLFVAGFLGSPAMNFLACEVDRGGDIPAIAGPGFRLPVPESLRARLGEAGRQLVLGVRPEDLTPAGAAGAALRGRIDVVEPLGAEVHGLGCLVADETQGFTVKLAPEAAVAVGDVLELDVDVRRMHLFDRETGHSLRGE
jgi:multiple sugar transport system ATP-binding protein